MNAIVLFTTYFFKVAVAVLHASSGSAVTFQVAGAQLCCYANLRNLGRLASELTKPLKVQLVHSLILSHIDYCNALFYNLSELLLHKLTKVLYLAVRFIFGLRGSALRMHMLPYLKAFIFCQLNFVLNSKLLCSHASACMAMLLHS